MGVGGKGREMEIQRFETYQPKTIAPNAITTPRVFNGSCLVRRYEVVVTEIYEPKEVIAARILKLWKNRSELGITHSSNIQAMMSEAKRVGIKLP